MTNQTVTAKSLQNHLNQVNAQRALQSDEINHCLSEIQVAQFRIGKHDARFDCPSDLAKYKGDLEYFKGRLKELQG